MLKFKKNIGSKNKIKLINSISQKIEVEGYDIVTKSDTSFTFYRNHKKWLVFNPAFKIGLYLSEGEIFIDGNFLIIYVKFNYVKFFLRFYLVVSIIIFILSNLIYILILLVPLLVYFVQLFFVLRRYYLKIILRTTKAC